MSLLATYLQDIRAQFPNPVENDEWRFTRYGMFQAVKEMTESPMGIVTEDLKQKALESEGRTLSIPVTQYGDVTVNNVRSCTIGSLDNTSALVDVTWSTLSIDISMNSAEHHKNEISFLQDLNKKIQRADHAFCKAIEKLIYAKLDTEKSGVYESPLVGATGTYPLAGDAMQVALADQEYFFNDLEAIMEGDDFYSAPFKVLGNTTLKPPVKHYINQGGGNDENLAYQFANYDFRFSNHLVNGAGLRATGFCLQEDAIGHLFRLNIDAELGHSTTDGTEWGKIYLPTLGVEVGVMYRSTCTDLSAQTGLEHLKATKKEFWQLSFDYALITQYNSDPVNKAGGIKKFEFLAA